MTVTFNVQPDYPQNAFYLLLEKNLMEVIIESVSQNMHEQNQV